MTPTDHRQRAEQLTLRAMELIGRLDENEPGAWIPNRKLELVLAALRDVEAEAFRALEAECERIREDFDLPDGVSAAGVRKIDRLVGWCREQATRQEEP